jgi:hypothetical protein
MAKTPSLVWAQRREKVFVTFQCLETTDVSVTLSDGLLRCAIMPGSYSKKPVLATRLLAPVAEAVVPRVR